MYLGGIETGGTKIVCGIGTEAGEIVERTSFPTTDPEETIRRISDFFVDKDLKAVGLGSFGPVDLNPDSKTYGYIKNTPKPNWSHFDLVGRLSETIDAPITFDTDVNAAAFGETEWGNAKGLDSCMYITVGTGIGVGSISEGVLIHGMAHPEMGHIMVRRHPDDPFTGACPYHGDCLEGLASGPAIEARWNEKGQNLLDRSDVWEMEAYYLAQAITHYILVLSPKKVIVGGGVMKQKELIPLIREKVEKNLNGYIQSRELENIDTYIVPPGLGDDAGLLGAIALAKDSVSE